jgi:hypothetical protein
MATSLRLKLLYSMTIWRVNGIKGENVAGVFDGPLSIGNGLGFDIGAVIGHVRQAYALLPHCARQSASCASWPSGTDEIEEMMRGHVKVTDLLLEVGSLDEFTDDFTHFEEAGAVAKDRALLLIFRFVHGPPLRITTPTNAPAPPFFWRPEHPILSLVLPSALTAVIPSGES